jgi:hypothetical protein
MGSGEIQNIIKIEEALNKKHAQLIFYIFLSIFSLHLCKNRLGLK